MLALAFGLLCTAAGIGTALVIVYLKGPSARSAPLAIPIAHAALGTAGLTLLILALRRGLRHTGMGTAGFGTIASGCSRSRSSSACCWGTPPGAAAGPPPSSSQPTPASRSPASRCCWRCSPCASCAADRAYLPSRSSAGLQGRLRLDLDLDAGALLLQQHRDPRVALLPAAVDRLGQFVERQIGEPHRHLRPRAPSCVGERHVLVGEAQREVGGS